MPDQIHQLAWQIDNLEMAPILRALADRPGLTRAGLAERVGVEALALTSPLLLLRLADLIRFGPIDGGEAAPGVWPTPLGVEVAGVAARMEGG